MDTAAIASVPVRHDWLFQVVRQLQCAAGEAATLDAAGVERLLENVRHALPPPRTPIEQVLIDGVIAKGILSASRWRASPPELAKSHSPLVASTLRLLRERYSERWTYARIGHVLGRDPEHIERRVRKEVGKTLHALLLDVRLARAYELAVARQKIESLPASVGFRSRSGFFKAFRNRYGCSPAAAKRIDEKPPA